MTSKLSSKTAITSWAAADQMHVLAVGELDRRMTLEDLFTEVPLSPLIKHSGGLRIDHTSGNDDDVDLITCLVTGTPKLWWDESEDSFALSKPLSVGPGTDTNFDLVTAHNVTATSKLSWDNLLDYGRPISAVGSLFGMFTLNKPLYIPNYMLHHPGRQSIYMGYGSTGTPYSFVDRVVNGLFASDTVWVHGAEWTIAGARASCDGTQTGDSDIYQTVASLVEGETYVIQYLYSRSAGSITALVGGTAGTTRTRQTGFELWANDTIIAGSDGKLTFRASHDFVGGIGEVRLYKQGEGYREFEGNQFFGHQAVFMDTVGGGDNSGFGGNVMGFLRNGGYNSAFGADCALHFRDAYYCSAFGKVSQYSNQDGYFNSSFGSHSLYYLNGDGLTTGIKVAAFGSYAGYNLRTGSGCSIFGHAAMYTGTANIQGCAFGYNSQYNTLGDDNSTFGTASGYTIRSGNRNVVMGSHVCSRSGLLDGNNNIVLGYDIDLLGDPSNTLSIGNLLFATGMTSNNTTISYGNVGIRTRTPRGALEINAATSGPCMYLTYNDEDGGALVNTVAFDVTSAGNLVVTPSSGGTEFVSPVLINATQKSLDAYTQFEIADETGLKYYLQTIRQKNNSPYAMSFVNDLYGATRGSGAANPGQGMRLYLAFSAGTNAGTAYWYAPYRYGGVNPDPWDMSFLTADVVRLNLTGAGDVEVRGGGSLKIYDTDGSDSTTFTTGATGDLTITPSGGDIASAANLLPVTDNTYYLGKNDDDTPFAWKGVILKDQAGTGKYYRLEVSGDALRIVDLAD